MHTDIIIPDKLFSNTKKTKEGDTGDGILDIFDRYNFTVKEDEPLEKEVAIDPELLGKAYEKFNAIRPDNYAEFKKALKSGKTGEESKFNKKFGVYYTPREIVDYMCQQSLINYLTTGLDGNANKEDIETLIKIGEHVSENEARVISKGKETKTYSHKLPDSIRNNAALIDRKLGDITVCDPAVGSGAFPVGMMSEIVRARNVLSTFIQDNTRTPYEFKRRCIEHSLYRVDIDPGAVEIAKLRLWLSLVVEEEDIKHIKPLPNLDYKIVCGNSLLGVEKNLFNHPLFNNLEKLKPLHFNETNPTKKQEYKKQIDDLICRITNWHKQFDFEVYFSEVFHEKGGFDVVIANPPYVGEKGHKDVFREIRQGNLKAFYHGQMDLFYFFFHLALNIVKQRGQIAFITTNYYITARGGRKLREDFMKRSIVLGLINFNELRIFQSALGQHNIITLLTKDRNPDEICSTIVTSRKGLANQTALNSILRGTDEYSTYYSVKQNQLYDGKENYIRGEGGAGENSKCGSVFQKMLADCSFLGSICNVNVGLYTGADKVTNSHLKRYNLDLEKGSGIFVIDEEERKCVELNSIEKGKIVPFFKNSGIGKYVTNVETNKFLIDISYPDNKHLDLNKIPNLFEHIRKFETILRNRSSNDNGLQAVIKRGYWWTFTKRQIDFCQPKIVVPQRSPKNTFGYNEVSWHASADVYFITKREPFISLKYILALLNSKLYFTWLYYRGKRKGESLELYQKPLSEIPIKTISEKDQKPFISIVDEILAVTKTNDYGNNKSKEAKVKSLEGRVDQLVYKLYGLTREEIKIVEGKDENAD